VNSLQGILLTEMSLATRGFLLFLEWQHDFAKPLESKAASTLMEGQRRSCE